ncbi:hypothetical protein ACLOJK_038073 [Asimina triloba]
MVMTPGGGGGLRPAESDHAGGGSGCGGGLLAAVVESPIAMVGRTTTLEEAIGRSHDTECRLRWLEISEDRLPGSHPQNVRQENVLIWPAGALRPLTNGCNNPSHRIHPSTSNLTEVTWRKAVKKMPTKVYIGGRQWELGSKQIDRVFRLRWVYVRGSWASMVSRRPLLTPLLPPSLATYASAANVANAAG